MVTVELNRNYGKSNQMLARKIIIISNKDVYIVSVVLKLITNLDNA